MAAARIFNTLEQERLEALESVLDGLEVSSADPARSAACCKLLSHLQSHSPGTRESRLTHIPWACDLRNNKA
jgi:hypothetical protein